MIENIIEGVLIFMFIGLMILIVMSIKLTNNFFAIVIVIGGLGISVVFISILMSRIFNRCSKGNKLKMIIQPLEDARK